MKKHVKLFSIITVFSIVFLKTKGLLFWYFWGMLQADAINESSKKYFKCMKGFLSAKICNKLKNAFLIDIDLFERKVLIEWFSFTVVAGYTPIFSGFLYMLSIVNNPTNLYFINSTVLNKSPNLESNVKQKPYQIYPNFAPQKIQGYRKSIYCRGQ